MYYLPSNWNKIRKIIRNKSRLNQFAIWAQGFLKIEHITQNNKILQHGNIQSKKKDQDDQTLTDISKIWNANINTNELKWMAIALFEEDIKTAFAELVDS